MEAKLALARWIVARSHGAEAAAARRGRTSPASCAQREAPDDVPEVPLPDGDPVHLPALLVASFGVASTSEARRLIGQGGVKLDGEVVAELDLPAGSGSPERCSRSASGASAAWSST